MPSTGRIPVVDGLPSADPCSIATPSNPIWPPEPEAAVLAGWAAVVLLLELEELLLPQPASSSVTASSAVNERVLTGRNGSGGRLRPCQRTVVCR